MPRTHGQAAGKGTRTYHAWKGMLHRCTNPASADWPRYGGRGITVCRRWHRFEDFLADMGQCPDDLTLDRINNDGDYEPGNCRWTTWEQQVRNRRTYRGERHANAKLTVDDVLSIRRLARDGVTYGDIAPIFGVSRTNVRYIVRGVAWRVLTRDPGHVEPARQRGVRDCSELEV